MANVKKTAKTIGCCCGYAVLVVLLILGVVSLLCCYFFDVQTELLSRRLVFKEGAQSVELWKNPPASIYRKFYFFNVTNSKDVLNGKKPVLQEIGPYSYKEIMEKKNVSFIDENTIKYTSVSTLYFDPSTSNGKETDEFTFLSLLDMGVSAKTDRVKPQVFIKKTVEEYISGYKSSLLELVALSTGKRREKFGLYFDKNGTGLNHYVASTGADDIFNLGKIKSWNDLKELNYWNNSFANAINGSDGSKYPPNIKKDQTLYFFNPDLCRSLSLEYLKDNNVEGVDTYDFHLSENIFSNNETLNPLYEGFCPNDDCLGDGVQSLRECKDGLPMFISLPHFLRADPKFFSSVVGLNASETKHDYIVSFEPMTGTTIKSNIRVQFNFHLKKNKQKEELKKVKDVLLPLFWLELDIDTKPEIKEKLKKIAPILDKAQRLLTILGGVFVCFSIGVLFYTIYRSKRRAHAEEYKKIELKLTPTTTA